MNTKILKPAVFVLAFIVSLALYWPAMNGTPIWDDFSFWFNDPVMKPSMSYSTIWANYAWPFSVSLQKLLMGFWQRNYTYYHLFCFCLHFANSLLVYKLGRVFRFKHPMVFFLLFLLHPACVITTAWMIQIKTLLCLFFGLASLLTFLKGNKDYRWMFFSWILFLLSITSKSASLTLPLIFLVISFKAYRFQKAHLLIPFFILSLLSTYKVLKSPITQVGAEKAAKVTKIKEAPVAAEIKAPEVKAPVVKPKKSKKPKKEIIVKKPKLVSPPIVTVAPKVEAKKTVIHDTQIQTSYKFIGLDISLITQTLHYYFWQSFMPINNQPIKGLNFSTAGLPEYFHILFLIIIVIACWKDSALIYLAAAHFLLLPFLGIIPAPFMNVTWVSDQHLYLVLPAMLAFWVRLVDKINWKYSFILPSLFVIFFSYKTIKTTPYYKDQSTFYSASLEYNPLNVPIAYNLAFSTLLEGNIEKAYYVASDAYNLAQNEPLMQKNIYYPHLVHLYLQLKLSMEKQ